MQEALNAIKNNYQSIDSHQYTVQWSSHPYSHNDSQPEHTSERQDTTKHTRKVIRCKAEVLSENHENDILISIIFFNEKYYDLYYPPHLGNVLHRKPINDESTENMPLIDLRDFGAPSGIGYMWHVLNNWICTDIRENEKIKSETGLLRLTFQSPSQDNADIQQKWILWLSPKHNYLPLHISHYTQNFYCSYSRIYYETVPGMSHSYFPRHTDVYILETPIPEEEYSESEEYPIGSHQQYLVRDLLVDSRLCERGVKITPAVGTVIHDAVSQTIFTKQSHPTLGDKDENPNSSWLFFIVTNIIAAIVILLFLSIRHNKKKL